MTTISAQTILRSRYAYDRPSRFYQPGPDIVLSTLLLRYPRCIHAELMTHRVFSRNAASSRAIPVSKLIQDVEENPFIPLYWGKNQKGMQAHSELTLEDQEKALHVWEAARYAAICRARAMEHLEVHKQIVNRLLEPFAHITVLVSSTQWSNFLALRDHPDAEPHIRKLAQAVRRELDNEDTIQLLGPGTWHTPFAENWDEMVSMTNPGDTAADLDWLRIKQSVACCASTSYKTVDGFEMTPDRANALHNKLIDSRPLHASPAEHVAQADVWRGEPHAQFWENPHQHGNFVGFRQYRKMLKGECL